METILDQDASRSAEHKTLEDLCNGDYKIDLSKYMNKSFEIFQKEWALFGAYTFVMILIFLVSLLAGIFAQIGIIACGIGLFFTAGFTEIFRYLAYEDVFGLASRRAEAE